MPIETLRAQSRGLNMVYKVNINIYFIGRFTSRTRGQEIILRGLYMKKIPFILMMLLVALPAFAAEEAGIESGVKIVLYICGIAGVAIAAIAGTYAQSKTASTALEGIARNPGASDKITVPLIISLALIESLVIFVIVSIFIVNLF